MNVVWCVEWKTLLFSEDYQLCASEAACRRFSVKLLTENPKAFLCEGEDLLAAIAKVSSQKVNHPDFFQSEDGASFIYICTKEVVE